MSLRFNLNTTLKRDIAELPDKMLDAAWQEIIQVVTTMKGYAQVLVRVETGSLRDSIRIERGAEGKYWRQIRLRAGGYVTNPKTGRLVDYAVIVEKKYPYMILAWEEVRGDVENLIKRRVLQEVQT